MSGVQDGELRKKLLAIRPFSTSQQVIDLCRSEEAAQSNAAELATGSMEHAHISQASQVQPQSKKPCRYCGRKQHSDRKECPARRATCNKCGVMGHFARVCEKSASATGTESTHTTTKVQTVWVLDVSAASTRPAPQVSVTLDHVITDMSYGTCSATPDTGADATMHGPFAVGVLGLAEEQMGPPPEAAIVAANGQSLQCVGTLMFSICLGTRSTSEQALVCSNHQGLLLAWFVCRDLGIIPSNYPSPLPDFPESTPVLLQDPTTRRWDRTGVVVEVSRYRTYRVKLPSGRVLWRNRRFLRPRAEDVPDVSPHASAQAPSVPTADDVEPAADSALPAPRIAVLVLGKPSLPLICRIYQHW